MKKSLYPWEVYKHECHMYTETPSLYQASASILSLDSVPPPPNVIYMRNQSLFFRPDLYARVRTFYPLRQNSQFLTDVFDGYKVTGSMNTISCSSIAGAP